MEHSVGNVAGGHAADRGAGYVDLLEATVASEGAGREPRKWGVLEGDPCHQWQPADRSVGDRREALVVKVKDRGVTAAAHGLSAVCDVCVAAVVCTLRLGFFHHAASDTPRAAAAGKDLDARCGLRIGV